MDTRYVAVHNKKGIEHEVVFIACYLPTPNMTKVSLYNDQGMMLAHGDNQTGDVTIKYAKSFPGEVREEIYISFKENEFDLLVGSSFHFEEDGEVIMSINTELVDDALVFEFLALDAGSNLELRYLRW